MSEQEDQEENDKELSDLNWHERDDNDKPAAGSTRKRSRKSTFKKLAEDVIKAIKEDADWLYLVIQ
jgi:hypothetical protein